MQLAEPSEPRRWDGRTCVKSHDDIVLRPRCGNLNLLRGGQISMIELAEAHIRADRAPQSGTERIRRLRR